MFPLIFREEGTEKRQLVASQMRPTQGWNPQSRRVPWPGIGLQPPPARNRNRAPTQLSHAARAKIKCELFKNQKNVSIIDIKELF